MRSSTPLLAKGLMSRSFDELKRRANIGKKPFPAAMSTAPFLFLFLSSLTLPPCFLLFSGPRIAWNLDAVKGASAPRPLYNFTAAEPVNECLLMCDDLIGGSSKAHLDFINESARSLSPSTQQGQNPPSPPPSSSQSPSSYARFHGSISTALPRDLLRVQRSGYAAFRTPKQSPTLFGASRWDIDPWAFLALRVKSDGRAYMVNVQTDGVDPTDLHQHRLFVRRPGHWETVLIEWNALVRTNYGFVIEPQSEILRQRVTTVGIGLTDRVEGPFDLCIERIWATNESLPPAEEAAAAAAGHNAAALGAADQDSNLLLGTGSSSSAALSAEDQEQSSSLKTKKGRNVKW